MLRAMIQLLGLFCALIFGSFAHTLTKTWTDSAGRTKTGHVTIPEGEEIDFDESVPIAGDTTYNLNILSPGLKTIHIQADHDITLTFKDVTPSTVGTLTLKAGRPYQWDVNGDATVEPILVSGDAVTMHTNAAAITSLQIYGLQDPTA